MAAQTPTTAPETGEKRSRFTFPSAFTVLFVVTILVWLLAFIVPTGAYKISEETGGPVPGSYSGRATPGCPSPTG